MPLLRSAPWLLCVALCNSCGDAAAAPTEAGASAEAQLSTSEKLLATSATYSLVGPMQSLGNQRYQMGWAATAVGARFNGSALNVRLEAVPSTESSGSHPLFDAVIDDGEPVTLALADNVTDYAIATGLGSGTHTVWLTKRTEPLVGSAIFAGFELPSGGSLQTPPARASRRIMVVGASNETGYGVEETVTASDMCTFSGGTENARKAYPYVLSSWLGAELTDLAWAGKGMLQNASPSWDTVTMPNLYNLLDPNDPNQLNDFSDAAPQLILLDLGANDYTSSTPSSRRFINTYVQFLQTLRGKFPSAQILCLMGPLVDEPVRSALQSNIQEAIAETSDDAVQFYAFDLYSGDTFGCDYHPDADLQTAMAGDLLRVVQSALGW